MRGVHIRTLVLWDQPVTSNGDTCNMDRAGAHTLLPGGEIHRARIGGQHDELCEGETGPVRDVGRCIEGGRSIAR